MATFLYALGRFSFRRRRLVAMLWIALLAVAGVGAASVSSSASDSFTIPGVEAQKAYDLLQERFPGSSADGATARVVFQAPDGDVTDASDRAAVERVLDQLGSRSEHIASVADPYTAQAVSEDGSTAYAQVTYAVTSSEMVGADQDALEHAAEAGRDTGLTVEVGGDALSETPTTGATEVIGVAVAAVVLVITFGSLVAAGLPLLTALIGVGISVAAITALTGPLGLDSTTPILAMMIGLAVGIDYALFIVSRYRAELAEGRERQEAAGRALGTAGSAVVFAGLTVVIALAGLSVVSIPVLTKMGLAAAGAVALAVLVALTLIPALLGFAGDRVRARRDRRAHAAGRDAGAEERPGMGARWARFVLRRPVTVLLAGVIGLGVVAIPATSLELGLPDDGSQPSDTTQRRAYDLIADGFGPGFNGPLTVAVDARGDADPQATARDVADTVSGLDDVAVVGEPVFNEPGDTAMITVIPQSAPSGTETEDLVNTIRAETGDGVLVTGQTAMNIDFSQKLSDALLPYLALVVGLAFLLLMVVFRSVLVPLKAALGFLLSVVAALGAVVSVFQWGWLAGLFGVEETGPVMSLMPIFMVGVVFGLAMDYEVFLVTRMREAYVHGEDPRQAIVTGFRHGARVVAAAAVIMISVFAGFIGSSESMVKMIGFGLAVAVLFDAFVVRMAIVPAVLALLGDRAWRLPRWLDRALPNVDVEGEALSRRPAGETTPERPAAEREPEPVGS
jgi:putative drug exporter of the RND superfamily